MHYVSRLTRHASRITFHVSRFTFALTVLTLLLATGWTPAPQAETIAIVGQVTNGTSGSAIPADLPVTLHVFSGAEESGTYTTTLSAGGSFRFDGLTAEEGRTFVVRVVHQDLTYFSEPGAVEPGQGELSLPVTIYETTEDPALVFVTQLHLFMNQVGERIQVGEYYLVGNRGDRTYVGVEDPEAGQRATLTFALPEGAQALSFDGPGLGERYLEAEGGFADTEPVPPGAAAVEVLFNYELPYREGLRVERAFDVPIESVALVLSAEGLALEGEGISPADVLETQMGSALSYAAGPLAAGEALAFSLVPGPPPAPVAPAGAVSSPTRSTAREAAVGLVALAAALMAVYLLWRSPAPAPLPSRARPLVESIVALDADFEGGQVSRKTYRQKRRSLKRQLRALVESTDD